jgi:hypothetical protein
MDQIVNLLAPGNPPSTVIGTATFTGLPEVRFYDLAFMAPVIDVQGRFFQFVPQPFYGPEPMPVYVEVQPIKVDGVFSEPARGV